MTNFVIGIGSQRAGSTLLHRILNDCTPIFMHPLKELHYYDTLFKVRHESILKKFSDNQLARELDRLANSKNHAYINKRYQSYIRANRLLSSKPVSNIEYLDLYRPCVSGHQYLGEITPEYMILPEEGIQKMSKDLGAETKIILIARNPVERLISSVKLLKLYNNHNADLSKFSTDFHNELTLNSAWLKIQHTLNDYKKALSQYGKYFNHILFVAYDQLFLKPELTVATLQNFLGVKVELGQYKVCIENRVNNLANTGEILQEDRAYLESFYEKEIQFLEDTFGKDGCKS